MTQTRDNAGTDLAELPRADMVWARDTTGPLLTMPYERQGERRLGAILIGSHDEESDVLRLTRFDSAMALPSRGALESRCGRRLVSNLDVDAEIIRLSGALSHKRGAPGFTASAARTTAGSGS